MKLSEVLKKYAYAFSEVTDIKIIACDDRLKIALTCETCNDIPIYELYTLDNNRRKYLKCYFDEETAKRAYNLLIGYEYFES